MKTIPFPLGLTLFAPSVGLILELGVADGRSFRALCFHAYPREVYGFDWFHGLPEAFGDLPVGQFSQDGIPPEKPENGEFIVGKVEDTLSNFLHVHASPIAFVHFDMDLYAPTKIALDAMTPWFRPGTVLTFDEIDGEPHCSHHEQRAFWEWREEQQRDFKFLGRGHRTSWVLQLK